MLILNIRCFCFIYKRPKDGTEELRLISRKQTDNAMAKKITKQNTPIVYKMFLVRLCVMFTFAGMSIFYKDGVSKLRVDKMLLFAH